MTLQVAAHLQATWPLLYQSHNQSSTWTSLADRSFWDGHGQDESEKTHEVPPDIKGSHGNLSEPNVSRHLAGCYEGSVVKAVLKCLFRSVKDCADMLYGVINPKQVALFHSLITLTFFILTLSKVFPERRTASELSTASLASEHKRHIEPHCTLCVKCVPAFAIVHEEEEI